MSIRPLVFLLGLMLGDYLLWNWSLNGNHDVLALVSGLSLPPLGVACIWLIALSLARVLARYTRVRGRARARAAHTGPRGQEHVSAGGSASPQDATATSQTGGSSRKLAA